MHSDQSFVLTVLHISTKLDCVCGIVSVSTVYTIKHAIHKGHIGTYATAILKTIVRDTETTFLIDKKLQFEPSHEKTQFQDFVLKDLNPRLWSRKTQIPGFDPARPQPQGSVPQDQNLPGRPVRQSDTALD